jgi:D-alanyl-D-alanine carboxypeptidase/D-alanyl-D-alanine-endopeptidase (penicillin-binding protein 4)
MLLSAVALVVVGAIVPIADTAFAVDTGLGTALDQVLAAAAGSVVAVQVREAQTGDVLYERNADQRVIPASNNQLLTSTAVLEVLGVDYRFHTRVPTSGTRNGSILTGSLYLKGGGDPTTLAADDELTFFTAPTSALTLAASNQFYDPSAVAVNAIGTTTGQPATLSMTPANGTERLITRRRPVRWAA